LIPLGFSSINKNILRQNIINYNGYFQVVFEKDYPQNFDNITMFKWMDFSAEVFKENVTAFYGICNESLDEFSLEDANYYDTVIFRDGAGLSNNSKFLNFYYVAIIYFIIVFII